MPPKHRILVIPGDGIGGEVMPPAVDVLAAAGERHGFQVETTWVDWGCQRQLDSGRLAPDGWLDQAREADAILLGAVGYPGVPDHVSLWGLLIPIRRAFDQYVNLRPVRSFAGVPGPLAGAPDVDVLIVRENTEGEYSQVGGLLFEGTDRECVVQDAVFSRQGIERIARYACEAAESRSGHVVAATKSNGLVHSMPYWDDVVRGVARDYDVQLELQHVDALAARFVLAPSSLDVVVASNLFGDILSDLGSAVVGGLGLAASANLSPDGAGPSMFEPVHGSAPDIAGRGIADPVAQILSVAMMLDALGEQAAAATVERAVREVLAARAPRTPDLGGTDGTAEVGNAVLERVTRA